MTKLETIKTFCHINTVRNNKTWVIMLMEIIQDVTFYVQQAIKTLLTFNSSNRARKD